jgi:hypothetical protein
MTKNQIQEMKHDLVTHNRIARLAADLTPAAFACLVTIDTESDEATVAAISGTNTQLFSQVNASARRLQAGWVPTITVPTTINPCVEVIVHERKPVSGKVGEFIDGVISNSLVRTTFARFSESWCYGVPLLIDDEIFAALIFASPNRLTKSQEDACNGYVEKCATSVASQLEERKYTQQIEELTELRRQVQLDDPLGLTQRRDATSSTPRSFGDIRLSLETQTAIRGNRELNLTRREFDLLNTFLQSPGIALSRVQIISRVWIERNGVSSNVLNVTVKNLREKLEAGGEPRVIHSLRAYGYVLKA